MDNVFHKGDERLGWRIATCSMAALIDSPTRERNSDYVDETVFGNDGQAYLYLKNSSALPTANDTLKCMEKAAVDLAENLVPILILSADNVGL